MPSTRFAKGQFGNPIWYTVIWTSVTSRSKERDRQRERARPQRWQRGPLKAHGWLAHTYRSPSLYHQGHAAARAAALRPATEPPAVIQLALTPAIAADHQNWPDLPPPMDAIHIEALHSLMSCRRIYTSLSTLASWRARKSGRSAPPSI